MASSPRLSAVLAETADNLLELESGSPSHSVPLKRTRSTRACDSECCLLLGEGRLEDVAWWRGPDLEARTVAGSGRNARGVPRVTGACPLVLRAEDRRERREEEQVVRWWPGAMAYPLFTCYLPSLAYTAPQRKRGPPKKSANFRPQAQSQSSLGQRLKTVETLLSGLITGKPHSPASPPSSAHSSDDPYVAPSTHGPSFENHRSNPHDSSDSEEDPDKGFKGVALAIHRPPAMSSPDAFPPITLPPSSPGTSSAAAVAAADAARRPSTVGGGPTFCQDSVKAGVTVSDIDNVSVLVRNLAVDEDDSLVAHTLNNASGGITIGELGAMDSNGWILVDTRFEKFEDLKTDTVLFYGSTSEYRRFRMCFSHSTSGGTLRSTAPLPLQQPSKARTHPGKTASDYTEILGGIGSDRFGSVPVPPNPQRWLGEGTSNTSAWMQSPRFSGGVMSITLSSEVLPVNPSAALESPPCSAELIHHLVSLYFTHIHPYFPMINRLAFLRQLKEKQTDHFSLLLNSMCALVTQQARTLLPYKVPSIPALHRAFFDRARVLLGKQFDWPHIDNVQALLLLTLVGAGTNQNASSYHYIGIAHRQAVELGMHRNLDRVRAPGLDESAKETKRATWFCLYILDRYTGVVEGRPFAINDDVYGIYPLFPCDSLDWDTPLPRQEEDGEVDRLIRHVALCSILGRIANHVNRPPRHSSPPKDELVRSITAELTQWSSLLPAELAAQPVDSEPWSFHHHLYTMFHTTTILLHRLGTGRFDGGACAGSAVAIRATLQALPDPSSNRGYVFVVPVVVYAGLTASTLFLDLALEARREGQREDEEDEEEDEEDDEDEPRGEDSGKAPKRGRFENRGQALSESLRWSLDAFEKLEDVAMFAVYYRQLIFECLRANGVKLETAEDDSAGRGPAPIDAQDEEADRDGEGELEADWVTSGGRRADEQARPQSAKRPAPRPTSRRRAQSTATRPTRPPALRRNGDEDAKPPLPQSFPPSEPSFGSSPQPNLSPPLRPYDASQSPTSPQSDEFPKHELPNLPSPNLPLNAETRAPAIPQSSLDDMNLDVGGLLGAMPPGMTLQELMAMPNPSTFPSMRIPSNIVGMNLNPMHLDPLPNMFATDPQQRANPYLHHHYPGQQYLSTQQQSVADGHTAAGPIFADSVFSELLNPFLDVGGWVDTSAQSAGQDPEGDQNPTPHWNGYLG
ncbi:fungal-specific transcription factor domain-containing protein [Blyttiomyces helicus]|uniref:Fungal-specific transcription factor domain-containing protein n=1 Tax=Blyttiomyces helicus TaxID=388810 RepID=A0A4P9WDN5_9FUNG|nr:fungal-specific transcription factor domain-containing protein [Blyttiomyces helicus]|eukprot:RKO90811.1 fungal-specific transcription factor domain-containing protein [Blyttiomyces helicus]